MKRTVWMVLPALFLVTACSSPAHNTTNSSAKLNGTTLTNTVAASNAGAPSNTSDPANAISNSSAQGNTAAPSNNTTAPTNTADALNTTSSANTTNQGTTNSSSTVENASTSTGWANQVTISAQTYSAPSQSVIYPQVEGLPDTSVQKKINALLKKQSMYTPVQGYADASSYTFTSSYNVVFQQGALMNFVMSSYFYPTGAAHGMPAHDSLIVNLKTGQTYQLKDMFAPGSDYLNVVSQVIRNQDSSHALNTFTKFTGVTNQDVVFLRPGGFVVDFSPYEWASYAQGFLDYKVPFSSVDGILDKSGSFWKALYDSSGFSPPDSRSAEQAKVASLGYQPSRFPEDSTLVSVGGNNYLSAWVGTKHDATASDTGYQNVFFFLNGKYLGTDTADLHGYVGSIEPNGAGTISVTYANYTADGVQKPFTIDYHWNGSKLVANGTFPAGYFKPATQATAQQGSGSGNSTNPDAGPAFPSYLTSLLASIEQQTGMPIFAPTEPTFTTPSTTVSVKSSTPTSTSYHVQLTDPSSSAPFGVFGGQAYSSTTEASHTLQLPVAIDKSQSGTPVPLQQGVTVTQYPFTWKADPKAYDSVITWHEGKWNIDVFHLSSDDPMVPVAEAQTVVSYLKENYLPMTSGLLTVNQPGAGPYIAQLHWVFGDNSYSAASTDLVTAMQLAVSMREYPTYRIVP